MTKCYVKVMRSPMQAQACKVLNFVTFMENNKGWPKNHFVSVTMEVINVIENSILKSTKYATEFGITFQKKNKFLLIGLINPLSRCGD